MARRRIRATRFLLTVSVAGQTVTLWEKANSWVAPKRKGALPHYEFRERYVASTSRFGIGQKVNSNRTPLGLHRIARKIGGDQPKGTVFKARVPIGTLADMPDATIVHRILWLAGLEPGLNRGGEVDTFRRYIYIHGFGDETSLGRPMSCGCVHLAADDLIPLYARVPNGTLVWIGRK
jgi:lipoprotein-anchoring transpeptidase ErfK/SrfK